MAQPREPSPPLPGGETGLPDTGVVRVFIALHISDAARRALEATMLRLQAAVPAGVRWVDPAGIHLTVKFLGNIDATLVPAVFEAMGRSARGAAPFSLRLSGLGMFPNSRQPRVLWAGVDGDLASLRALQSKVDDETAALGFERERRPFSPHLTLGRVREGAAPAVLRRVAAAISAGSLDAADPWLVESVHLMRSTLTPSGAIYTSLGSVPLWTE